MVSTRVWIVCLSLGLSLCLMLCTVIMGYSHLLPKAVARPWNSRPPWAAALATYGKWPKYPSTFNSSSYQHDQLTNATPAEAVRLRVCTQEERLAHLESVCSRQHRARQHSLMTNIGRAVVDSRHNVTLFWVSKSGCTTFKSVLLEASGIEIKQHTKAHNMMPVHSKTLQQKAGLKEVKDLNQTELEDMYKHYFIFLVMRNPFERLLSTYRGKVMGTDSDFPWFAKESLRLAQPEVFKRNASLVEMKDVRPVLGVPTFNQFLRWVKESKVENDHWSTVLKACHPCAVRWSALLRLETMMTDGILLLDKLRPDINYTEIPVRHSHQKQPVSDHDTLWLPEYADVSSDIIDFLLERFELDMELFGHHWDRASNTATCRIDTPNGPCC